MQQHLAGGRGRQRVARLPEYPERTCDHCGAPYRPYKINQRFCGQVCQQRRNAREYYIRTHGKPPDTSRACGICGADFPRRDRFDWRRQFCSEPCQKEARRRRRKRFHERNPEYRGRTDKLYNSGGWSTTVTRFFRRCPDVPRRCSVADCGESRVVDIHHKRHRQGVPVRATNTQRDHVWVLCPNHHAMIHRGVATPEALGLA